MPLSSAASFQSHSVTTSSETHEIWKLWETKNVQCRDAKQCQGWEGSPRYSWDNYRGCKLALDPQCLRQKTTKSQITVPVMEGKDGVRQRTVTWWSDILLCKEGRECQNWHRSCKPEWQGRCWNCWWTSNSRCQENEVHLWRRVRSKPAYRIQLKQNKGMGKVRPC